MNKLIILSIVVTIFIASSLVVAATDIEAKHQIIGKYNPGSILEINNTFTYSGNLLSLLWRPILPEGWTLVSGGVSGEGSPELQYGEIVWVGTSLPQSPIEMKYSVQVPSNAEGAQTIQAEVEFQFMGMANANKISSNPNPLTLSSIANQNTNKAASNNNGNCWEATTSNGSKVMRCAGLISENNETKRSEYK